LKGEKMKVIAIGVIIGILLNLIGGFDPYKQGSMLRNFIAVLLEIITIGGIILLKIDLGEFTPYFVGIISIGLGIYFMRTVRNYLSFIAP
jgi:hypothetical protein